MKNFDSVQNLFLTRNETDFEDFSGMKKFGIVSDLIIMYSDENQLKQRKALHMYNNLSKGINEKSKTSKFIKFVM